ncbi:MAG: hypothetical protein LBR70_01120 [Lactobacillaceae bacterium]|jgi:hypothetical protein|nr:hypothetical protein [Lactobacillaceae bacterium]
MNKFRILMILALLAFLTACSSSGNGQTQRETYANEENVISLREPKTRVIVRCYPNEYQPAEFCAQMFEEKGYVRFKDIPHKPAKYDFLTKDTYPTRRWREGEASPRW